MNDSEEIMLLVEITEPTMMEDWKRLGKYMWKVDMQLILPYSFPILSWIPIVLHWNWAVCEFEFGEFEMQNYTEVKLARK